MQGRVQGDGLGDRMKANYENRTRYYLPRRTYTLVRVDGKAFHTFTRRCERPFDARLMAAMDRTALAMCDQMGGSRLAYVQSDEISVLLTDFETIQSDAWFDGNIQKIASISASIATAAFNQEWQGETSALFDARVFTVPDPIEVENYFIWRQQDATRNSIQMAAQAQFSHRELEGESCDRLQERLWQEKGINWNDYPAGCKRGRVIRKVTTESTVAYTDRRTGQEHTIEVERPIWTVCEPPVFTQERDYLRGLIPKVV
jgi:tRNA(His) 5'-end guanylyltransferase